MNRVPAPEAPRTGPGRAERWLHRPAVRLNERLARVQGWRRHALAAAFGALAALALPPVHAVVLLVPAFVGLVWLVDQSPRLRAALAAGWWFGLGHFVIGLYWIAFALLTDPVKFGWMIPFAIGGLSAGMALFPAAAAGLARLGWTALARARGPVGAGRVVLFAVFWMALEWVRAWVLTGFPWNLIGTVWTFSDAMIQLAAVAGVYGLSLLTVAAAAMPAVLADRARGSSARAWWPVAGAFAALILVWAGGLLRLAGADEATVPGVRLRLVQPNIPQTLKWDPAQRQQHVVKQIRMSLGPPRAPSEGTPARPPTHVIWAETAVPYYVANEPALLAALGSVVREGGAVIVGAPRTTPEPSTPFRVWNSLHAIDAKGRVVATYDKFHLVPFGEYVPFRKWLPIAKITHGATDFSRGPGPRTVTIPGLPPVSPLICYEVIFPTAVSDPERRPGWLLNITNDAWFGISSGPYQHLAAARLRAVEEGLPLVRVANNGISGIVDAYGRMRARLGLGREGVIDGDLPVALAPPPYGHYGDRMTLAILLVAAAAAFAGARRRGKTG